MRNRIFMSLSRVLIPCAFLLGTLQRSASAEDRERLPNPLVEMRAAAEALADVHPDAASGNTARQILPKVVPSAASLHKEALSAMARGAVRVELSRELTLQSNSNGRGLGAAASKAPGLSSNENAHGANSEAHEASIEAQTARLNRGVSAQHAAKAEPPQGPPSEPPGKGGMAKLR